MDSIKGLLPRHAGQTLWVRDTRRADWQDKVKLGPGGQFVVSLTDVPDPKSLYLTTGDAEARPIANVLSVEKFLYREDLPRRAPFGGAFGAKVNLSDLDLNTDLDAEPEPRRRNGWTLAFRAALLRAAAPVGVRHPEPRLRGPSRRHMTMHDQRFRAALNGARLETWVPTVLAYLARHEEPDDWLFDNLTLQNEHFAQLQRHPDPRDIEAQACRAWHDLQRIATDEGERVSGPFGQRFAMPTRWFYVPWNQTSGATLWQDSHEALVERLLNGIAPLTLHAGPEGTLRARVTWPGVAAGGKAPYQAPRALEIELSTAADPPALRAIRFAAPGTEAFAEAPAATAADRAHARRVARSVLFLAGELDWHFVRAHLLTEQYLMALMTTPSLRASEPDAVDHPVFRLLSPHLRSSDRINRLSDPLIVGRTGILSTACGLTADEVQKRLADQLGQITWKGWTPRAPVCPGDRYGHASKVFWELTRTYVAGQLKGMTAEQWAALEPFARQLFERSPRYVEPAPFTSDYASPEIPARDELGGVAKAMHRLGTRDGAAWKLTGTEQDEEDLVQLCTHAIFHATFFHSWTGGAQFQDGGNIDYAPLGFRKLETPVDEDDYYRNVAPLPHHAGMQLALVDILTHTNWGYVLRSDEYDNDVPAAFKAAVAGAWPEWEKLGIDPLGIRARINT